MTYSYPLGNSPSYSGKTMQSGIIFDVKRYSINDGPGIRATIFLKGCFLNCAWCHNPESISPHPQKMYSKEKCIGCKTCVEACPENACNLTPAGIVTDQKLCTLCGICADVCPTKAVEMSGETSTIDDLMEIIEKERVFFDQSGGGVTISGGEPLMQADFLISLLDELGDRSIHRAVDTTGFVKTDILLEVAKRTDLFLFDLKVMDADRHKEWTGVDNHIILKNLKILAETGANITIRIPLIHGVNDDEENLLKTAAFVAGLAGTKKNVDILPYHNIMAGKYQKLGQSFDGKHMSEPDTEVQNRAVNIFMTMGIKTTIGG